MKACTIKERQPLVSAEIHNYDVGAATLLQEHAGSKEEAVMELICGARNWKMARRTFCLLGPKGEGHQEEVRGGSWQADKGHWDDHT